MLPLFLSAAARVGAGEREGPDAHREEGGQARAEDEGDEGDLAGRGEEEGEHGGVLQASADWRAGRAAFSSDHSSFTLCAPTSSLRERT
jgi:hypothetical protein